MDVSYMIIQLAILSKSYVTLLAREWLAVAVSTPTNMDKQIRLVQEDFVAALTLGRIGQCTRMGLSQVIAQLGVVLKTGFLAQLAFETLQILVKVIQMTF